ncbi:MAG: adenosine deaminase [Ktedonobacterales bacterium]
MSIGSYLKALPKVELHVHLEGSIQPGTLLTLARRNGVTIPASTLDELRDWFAFRNFEHFMEIYLAITQCLRTAEDYELIAYEFGAEMARQNVRYAEVTFSPSTHHFLGVSHDTYFGGLTRGRERARRELGVEITWIFDIVRDIADSARRVAAADYTTGVAIEGKNDGVVALGLGGAEQASPPEPFAPWFQRARDAGLHSAPHAGETEGPESVWGAIRALGAERIGHGVRSIEDAALVAYLAEHRIPLEVNPTSNLRLGVYRSLEEHPLRRLYDAGVFVTVNSDDPPVFNTTLNDEVQLLHSHMHFALPQIDAILLNAIRASFLPEERKRELETAALADMATLKAAHGLDR